MQQTQMAKDDEVAREHINAVVTVSFGEALLYWLKLGFISFGGPAGQIAIMHHDLVERKRWISEKRFLHALNFCMVLPGPEAQQLATYIGWLMHRTLGGVIAGGLFVLPSLFILIGLSWVYMAFGSVPAVAGVLYGIKPAVTAIVVFAAYRIGSRALKNAWLWSIAAAAFLAVFVANVPFPIIVLAAGIVGHFGGKYAPSRFVVGGDISRAKRGLVRHFLTTTRPPLDTRSSHGSDLPSCFRHSCSYGSRPSGCFCSCMAGRERLRKRPGSSQKLLC